MAHGRADIPLEILRLAQAFVFASPEPGTWKMLRPLLPDHLDPTDVLDALKRHCADRGVILVETGGAWTFRTAAGLAPALQTALTQRSRLPRDLSAGPGLRKYRPSQWSERGRERRPACASRRLGGMKLAETPMA